MKQTFGVILIVVGVVAFFRGAPTCHGIYELIGMVIGIGLVCGLPAYFFLRKPKDVNHSDNMKNQINLGYNSTKANINNLAEKDNSERFPKPVNAGLYESLFQELTSKCNPKMFMEPYDYAKIEKANELFSQILNNKENPDKLKELRKVAREELGVQFSTEALFRDLCASCNPIRFTSSDTYDPEKLSLANKLYERIQKSADDIEELERIKEIVEKEGLFTQKKIEEEDDGEYVIGLAIFVILILIMAMVATALNLKK